MKTVVVLPTYNEAENIELLLESLLAIEGLTVLVVDDSSPDGTAERARSLGSDRVHVLSGEKRGLGDAYRRGIRHALEDLGADTVIEMDADLSHDPADIPRLLDALSDADAVIGSRYVNGGTITGWSKRRRILSRTANTAARHIARLPLRDCTAGFRAIRAEALREIDWRRFPVRGYAFQIMLLERLRARGARIVEIPVHFRDRTRGSTKLGMRDIAEFAVASVGMGWRAHARLRTFLLVGLSGAVVNLALFTSLLRVAMAPVYAAWIIAVELSILWNFSLHERFTFHDRSARTVLSRAGRYHLTTAGGIIINLGVFSSLLWFGALPELANAVAIAAATTVNYLGSKHWAWAKNP